MSLAEIMDKLSDERKNVIYRIAIDMLNAQCSDFDYLSPEDIAEITESDAELSSGRGVPFDSAEEMCAYFKLR